MDNKELKPCPICNGPAEFKYGGEMSSGKRIVKAGCKYGCAEQAIYVCEEEDVARAWNYRAPAPQAAQPVTSKPYGYLWYNEHMEYRFTLQEPLSCHKVLGEIKRVYDHPATSPAPAVVPSELTAMTLLNAALCIEGHGISRAKKDAMIEKLNRCAEQMHPALGGAAALAQVPAAKEQVWQPIETAPKDNREVLLRVKLRAGMPGCQLVGHYMPGGHCIEDHPPIASGWYFWNGCSFDRASEPTHWMPLPKAPLAQSPDKAEG